MSLQDLRERLNYFEARLSEALQKSVAKEPRPKNFDAGYTTEKLKTWAETIALIRERIASIKTQLGKD